MPIISYLRVQHWRRGCGPLLITTSDKRKKAQRLENSHPREIYYVALLLRLYNPSATNLVSDAFDKIMDAVCQGMVDAGVIIHESRFTYQKHGPWLRAGFGRMVGAETGLPFLWAVL